MKTQLALSALCVVALACASPADKTPATSGPLQLSQDEWRVTDNVVVVTDASWSMYEHQTFPEAKALTRAFVASLPDPSARAEHPEQYQVGTVGFGGSDRTGSTLGALDRDVLAEATGGLDIMGSPTPNTPLDEVLGEIEAALTGVQGRTAVVIFSDGGPDSPEATIIAAQSLATSLKDGVCIHTVHTGQDATGAALLAQLANTTSCGSTREGSSVSSAQSMDGFTRSVMIAATLPQVAAPNPCDTVLRLQALHFDFDRAAVREAGAPVLNAAVEHLKKCPNVRVRIDGHTDAVGTPEYNEGLSDRRASSVEQYLIDAGIPASQLSTQGFGENNPVAPNDSSEGRQENRRVELAPQG
jgi:outer membrane protein OmpA-like peptidoglycan-associated protein